MLELENEDDISVLQIVTRVRLLINELLESFSISCPNEESDSSSLPPIPTSSSLFVGSKLIADRQKKPLSASNSHNEFGVYLTTVFYVGGDFQILDFWKQYKMTFPTVSKVALQVLAVPASTVAVEQTFSSGGNILDAKRSRLAPEALEAQVCVDDWSRALQRTQDQLHSSSSEGEEFFDGASTTNTSDSNDES